MISSIYIGLLIFVSFIIVAYFIFIFVYMIKYINAVSYSTDNYIKCDKEHCTDEVIEEYSYIPRQLDNSYSREVSKFCAQLILRLEYAHKYKTMYPSLLKQILSVQDKYKNPIFCAIFMDEILNNAWIVLRGTYTFSEFVADIDYSQINLENTDMKVHRGFYKIYKNVRNQIFKHLKKYNVNNVFITGHSLGAAIATLISIDMYKYKYNAYVYGFGSPRVGNMEFAQYINKYCNVYNIINQSDVVTNVPPSVSANFVNKKDPYFYNNSGQQIIFDDNWLSLKNNHRMPVYIKNL